MCSARELVFKFYSEELRIEYDDGILLNYKLQSNDQSLKYLYSKWEVSNYQPLLCGLIQQRESLGLNDWFNFILVRNACKELYSSKGENFQIAFCWFILNKMGYNVNIRYVRDKFTLYIYSKSLVRFTDSYNHGRKKFIQLNFRDKEPANSKNVYMLKYFPNRKGKCFDFSLGEIPRFKSNKTMILKKIFFTAHGQTDSIVVGIDKTLLDVMVDYPMVGVHEYFKVGFSEECSNTLLPLLKEKTRGMGKEETITYLLSFVRTGFVSKDDKIAYGHERPMIAEEVLYYPVANTNETGTKNSKIRMLIFGDNVQEQLYRTSVLYQECQNKK